MRRKEIRGVSPVVGTILLIAITVALAAIVATLVGGLGMRVTPPSAMLSVTAESTNENTYKLIITHEGGDDLVVADLNIVADNSPTAMKTYSFPSLPGDVFSVGGSATLSNCSYIPGPVEGKVITVYIIHVPSKQKIFSSSAVFVR